LQEIAKVYGFAVDGPRQRFVEFCRNLDARADIVEQHANLLRRKAPAAPGNGVALEAKNAAQAGEVVRYAMVGLGQPDDPMVYRDRHFVSLQMETMRLESPKINKTIICSNS
jgi:hypothetical protein